MTSIGATPPFLFIIFGALGDLSRRKLLPALFNLHRMGSLGPNPIVLGVDLDTGMDDSRFRSWVRDALRISGISSDDITSARWCDSHVNYQPIGAGGAADFTALVSRIKKLEEDRRLSGNRIFYLAIPTDAFPNVIAGLGESGLHESKGWSRVVMEKPVGWDFASARKLNETTHKYFKESQIYRIDHFLGKDTVRNLLAFRFANAIFEQLWSRGSIDSVEISVAESIGVERRAAYYEKAGALRDMVQNHLIQLLTLISMEIPSSFEPDSIRYEKIKVLREIIPIEPADVVFGQYERGKIADEEVPGYREDPGVSPNSNAETFVALKLHVGSWRWKGVPFYLRTGKRLPQRGTQIVITFHCAPVAIFHPFQRTCDTHPNMLVMRLQPDEGFDLFVQIKGVGEDFKMTTQKLHFRYAEAFGPIPDAYSTLILDVIKGDLSLFVSAEEVEAAWQLFDPLLKARIPVHGYTAGTWGPAEVSQLQARWHEPGSDSSR